MQFQFLYKTVMAAAILIIAPVASIDAQTTTTSKTTRPNIVLILADDMDYVDVGLYGGKLTPTPNIDSIAKNGVEFTNAYVSCPVCGPSRVGILTGRYQDRIGYVTNHGPKIPENFGLPTTATIVSETLNKAGYGTGMVGKWHLGFKPDMVPTARGFDFFFGHLHGFHDYHPGVEKPGPILRNGKPVKTTKYLTREFGDEAVKFIKEHQKNPYFLYVPFNAVHGPLQAPEETLRKFSHIRNERDRTMAAMVYELDVAVGRILQAVRDSGDEKNTIIVFTNDNGGTRGNLPESNGELRGGKMTVYEGGIRVPMFMQWKGIIPAGSKYEKPVITLDLAPTFVAAAQATSNVDYEGVNLLPYITGKKAGTPHEELFWRFIDAPNQKAVRKGDWKAVQPADKAPWELYNLKDDIGETNNLSEENPSKLKELRRDWRTWNADNAPPLFLDSRIIKRRARQEAAGKGKAPKAGKNKKRKRGGRSDNATTTTHQ